MESMRSMLGSSAARRVCAPNLAYSTSHSPFSHSTGPITPPLWQRAQSACARQCRPSSWFASRSRPCTCKGCREGVDLMEYYVQLHPAITSQALASEGSHSACM